jgi:hypothetical protein
MADLSLEGIRQYGNDPVIPISDFAQPSSSVAKGTGPKGGNNLLPWLLAGADMFDTVNRTFFGGSPTDGGYRPAGGRLNSYLEQLDRNSLLERILGSVASKQDEEQRRYDDYAPTERGNNKLSSLKILNAVLGGGI